MEVIGFLVVSAVVSATCSTNVCQVQQQVVRRQVVQPVVKRQVVSSYVAPVAHAVDYQQQVLYFVGAPVRVQSLVEQQKRTDPDYQDFLQYKAFRAGQEAQRQEALQQEHRTETPPAMPAPSGVTIRSVCAKCHGKASPDGDFYLDGGPGITSNQVVRAIRAIASGDMPKHRKLSAIEKNQLLSDLLALHEPEEQE